MLKFILIAILGASLFFAISSTRRISQSDVPSASTLEEIDISKSEEDSISSTGHYQLYSDDAFVTNSSSRRVLYFYANWCPTCIPVDKDFQNYEADIPEDVVVFRINYNDSDTDSRDRELAAKYKITYQHTFVEVDQAGEEVKRWTGGGLAELKSELN